jgi:hypothetical protein
LKKKKIWLGEREATKGNGGKYRVMLIEERDEVDQTVI